MGILGATDDKIGLLAYSPSFFLRWHCGFGLVLSSSQMASGQLVTVCKQFGITVSFTKTECVLRSWFPMDYVVGDFMYWG